MSIRVFAVALTWCIGGFVECGLCEAQNAQPDSDAIETLFRGVCARDAQLGCLQGVAHSYGKYSTTARAVAQSRLDAHIAEIRDRGASQTEEPRALAEKMAQEAATRIFGGTDLQYVDFAVADDRWFVRAVALTDAGIDDPWNICAVLGIPPQSPACERSSRPWYVYASDGRTVSSWRWPSDRVTLADFEPKWRHMTSLSWLERYLLLRIMGKPAGEGLRASFPAAQLAGREQIAGAECLKLVELHVSPKGGAMVRLSAWIAPDKGFAVLGWEDFVVSTDHPGEGYLRVIKAQAVEEVAKDIWLPKEVVHHEYLYRPGEDDAWQSTRLVQFDSLEVKHDIDWLQVACRPALGTFVDDRRAENAVGGQPYYEAGGAPRPAPPIPHYDAAAAAPITGTELGVPPATQ